MCLEGCSVDHFFLILMTFVMCMILYVDLAMLLEMFREYFKVESQYSKDTFEHCYKPQAELRMCFQCVASYCAGSCVLLIFCVAFNLGDKILERVANWMLNASCLIFGPVLLLISTCGFSQIKALSRVCDYRGIREDQINMMSIFILLIGFGIGLGITFTMLYEQTMLIAQSSFSAENSVLYRLMQIYAAYNLRINNI